MILLIITKSTKSENPNRVATLMGVDTMFKKTFLHALAVLDYLPKLKRGLGLGSYFMNSFSIKMFLI